MYECLIPSEIYLGEKENVLVVLGWYNIKNFRRKIDKKLYGVASSLFNGDMGSEILIRNLLYNPQITDIVLCNITYADTWINYPCKQFVRMLEKLEKTDPEVRSIVQNVTFYQVSDEKGLLECLSAIIPNTRNNTRVRVVRPMEKIDAPTMPSQYNGQSLTCTGFDQAHQEIVSRIYYGGKDYGTKEIRELLNLSVTLTKLPQTYTQLLDECSDSDKSYIEQFYNGVRDPYNYGYGNRLRNHFDIDQIEEVIIKLIRKPQTLAANMVLWDVPKDLVEGSSPCLTQIWLRREDNKLHMSVVFRSNDMYKAWRSNVKGLRGLQIRMCESLRGGVIPGDLTTMSMSAHIYHMDFDQIAKCINTKIADVRQDFLSQVGLFVIGVCNQRIIVTQTTIEGAFVKEYQGTKAKLILKDLLNSNPSIEKNHLVYLADELYDAEFCLRNYRSYTQD